MLTKAFRLDITDSLRMQGQTHLLKSLLILPLTIHLPTEQQSIDMQVPNIITVKVKTAIRKQRPT